MKWLLLLVVFLSACVLPEADELYPGDDDDSAEEETA